ncbi:hypothetical protein [Micromonospora chersina]|uniref:hypothetical protein n=1 Tax=Micromonospora chersina TaxID=47854 RepID=UPI0033E56BA8
MNADWLTALAPTPAPPATPNVTDWMQGYGSVLGLAVGVLAAAVTGALLVYEIRHGRRADASAAVDRAAAAEERELARQDRDLARQDRELAVAERQDAEAAQARTILYARRDVERFPDGRLYSQKVGVKNYGIEPVTAVVFEVANPTDPGNDHTVKADVLGAGESLDLNPMGPLRTFLEMLDDVPRDAYIVTITFADIHGYRWRRVDNGLPERLLDESSLEVPAPRALSE